MERAIVTVGIEEAEFFEKIGSIVDSKVKGLVKDIVANMETKPKHNLLITQSQACEILDVCYETFVKKYRRVLKREQKVGSVRYYSNDVFALKEKVDNMKVRR